MLTRASLFLRARQQRLALLPGFTAAACLFVNAVSAADLPHRHVMAPNPVSGPAIYAAPAGGFYLRGDIGLARNVFGGLAQADLAANGGTFIKSSIADTTSIGIGFGWQINQRFRFDLTGEYRAKTSIRGLDNLSVNLIAPDGALQANTQYQGELSSALGLLNGYWDIGNWRGFTPYVGAGVGIVRHTVSGLTSATSSTFTDALTGVPSLQLTNGAAADRSATKFAWALMAGASFDISPNAKFDVGYRYLNLGSRVSAASGLIDCVCGTIGGPLQVNRLRAHELRMGIRWTFTQQSAPPLMAKF